MPSRWHGMRNRKGSTGMLLAAYTVWAQTASYQVSAVKERDVSCLYRAFLALYNIEGKGIMALIFTGNGTEYIIIILRKQTVVEMMQTSLKSESSIEKLRCGKSRRRNKKQEFLRSLLRRNTCIIITGVNCATVALHCVAFIGLYLHMLQTKREMEQRKFEDSQLSSEVLRKYYNLSSFQHCDYKMGSFFTKVTCDSRCGNGAFINRYRWLRSPFTDSTCIDQNDQVKCFDDESMCRGIIEEKAFRPCGGLRDTKIDKKRLITTEQLVIVPLMKLDQYISSTLLSQKLIGLCPRCYYHGQPLYVYVVLLWLRRK
uniref:WSC domain-containing protein n=1 Tax=Ascaris lumbricoides TaxID=6252 RepID=A0A0M3HYT9_ASCLU